MTAMTPETRSRVIFATQLVFGVAILVACLTTLDLAALPAVLSRIQPAWMVLALALSIVGTVVIPAIVTKRALEIERIRISLWDLTIINFAIRLYVLVLPRAASIGIRWLRYSKGGSGHDALALMAFERVVQIFTMMLIATAVLPLEFAALSGGGVPLFLAATATTVASGLLLVSFLVPAATKWLVRLGALCDRFAPTVLARQMVRLLESVRAFHALKKTTAKDIVILSIVGYVLFILSAYVVAVAMDLKVSLAALAWIRPMVFLLTLLPFTVGGLGVREAGFITLLGLYGVPRHESLAFSLAVFSLQIMIGLVGAATEAWGLAGKRWKAAG
jgi:hypothetical protein